MTVIERTSRRECPEHGWPEWANMADEARCPKCNAELAPVEYVLVRADVHQGAVGALTEIRRAFIAWDNDEDFGLDTDQEMRFGCDAEFLDYIGALAGTALASPRQGAPEPAESNTEAPDA